jgi:hypothetical protein
MQEGEAFCVSAEEEEAFWLKRVSEVERKEERLLDLRLEGNISTEQFHAKRAALQETKEIAKTGLEARRSRRSRLEDFERDKEALLEYHARLVPEDVDGLTPRIKADSHLMMHLTVYTSPDGSLIAEWGCNALPTPPGSSRIPGR